MDEPRYKIVFNGLVMMETPEETVKTNLARLFKCDLARIEPLFSGETAVLKRNLGEQEADHYMRVLRDAGAIVHKEREQPAKPVTAPVTLELAEKPEPVKPADAPAANATASVSAPTASESTDPFNNAPAWAQARSPAQEQRPVYKSPTQELAELREQQGSGGYCEIEFISLKGRLGRLRYFAWPMITFPLLILTALVAAFLSTKFPPLAKIGSWGVQIIVLAFYLMLTFRRLHDINMSGWWMLLWFAPILIIPFLFLLAPILYIAFALFLLLKAGDDGDNDYGPPPPPNSTGVKVAAASVVLLYIFTIYAVFYFITHLSFSAPS
jgi:uncharacterized membrane protein YhaH (DUF805 family)